MNSGDTNSILRYFEGDILRKEWGDEKNSKKVKKGKEGYESRKCDNTNEYVLVSRRNTQRTKNKKI